MKSQNTKRLSRKIIISVAIIVLVSFVVINIFLTNNINLIGNKPITLEDKFYKIGVFTTNVEQALITNGIDYVKTYYISELKNGYPETDIEKTKEYYKCSYTKPAKDDQYLYLNLTCIGDAYDNIGKKTGAPLTGFGDNPTKLKYYLRDGKYSVTEMDQPISPKVYQYSLPTEYVNYLNTK